MHRLYSIHWCAGWWKWRAQARLPRGQSLPTWTDHNRVALAQRVWYAGIQEWHRLLEEQQVNGGSLSSDYHYQRSLSACHLPVSPRQQDQLRCAFLLRCVSVLVYPPEYMLYFSGLLTLSLRIYLRCHLLFYLLLRQLFHLLFHVLHVTILYNTTCYNTPCIALCAVTSTDTSALYVMFHLSLHALFDQSGCFHRKKREFLLLQHNQPWCLR